MPRIPGEIDRRRFVRAMARLGWHVTRVSGSHHVFVHAEGARPIVVAIHHTVRRGAVLGALKEAGIDLETFLEEL